MERTERGGNVTEVRALELSRFRHPESSPIAGRTGIVMSFLISHARGAVVVDTGIGSGNGWIDNHYQPRSVSVEALLRAEGVGIDDVLAVVNSHLHFDHAGQNQRFPARPIYVQAAEYEAARSANYTLREWVDFDGADYRQLNGDFEILPGVLLMHTPGHTPGHQSVVIDGELGPTIIAGQAVYDRAEWQRSTTEPAHGEATAWNAASYRNSVRRLRRLRPEKVFFAHDPLPWVVTPPLAS